MNANSDSGLGCLVAFQPQGGRGMAGMEFRGESEGETAETRVYEESGV